MTAINSTTAFVQKLNAVLQRGQQERERVLGLLNMAADKIQETRSERDGLKSELQESARRNRALDEQNKQLQQQNQRLQDEIKTMMSALDAAVNEFTRSDASLVDRLNSISTEMDLPVSMGRSATQSSVPDVSARRPVVRGAPYGNGSDVFGADEVGRRLNQTMGSLERILNNSTDIKH